MDSTWGIGKARITSFLDTEARLPIQGLIPQATAEALASHIGWLVPDFLDEKGRCTFAMHLMVIESSGKKIVVDTGWGGQVATWFQMGGTRDSG